MVKDTVLCQHFRMLVAGGLAEEACDERESNLDRDVVRSGVRNGDDLVHCGGLHTCSLLRTV